MARDIVGLKINADLLDGLSASDFAQVSGSATFSGSVTATDLVVDDGGTIGSTTTTDAMTVNTGGAVIFKTNLQVADNGYIGNSTNSTQMRLLATGDVQFRTGNLVFTTSGDGIDFSATSDASGSTSELLDDYEEGTWTPEFVPGSGSFTTMTYNTQVGEYTKIGNVVQFRCILSTDNVDLTGASGSLQIDGLPFTPLQSAFSVAEMLLWANAYNTIQADRSGGNIRLLRTAYGSAFSILQTTDLTTGASTDQNRITIAGTFFTA